MLNYREITSPAAEPVALSEAKQQLRIDIDDDDDLLLGYIVAARQYVEKVTSRSIYNRTIKLTLDYFPWPDWETATGSSHDAYLGWYFRGLSIRLPRPAVVSVESVQYIDDSGELRTLDPSTYVVDTVSEPARISPAPGYTWPYQQNYRPSQVVINYTSGTYGDGVAAANCPQTIKLAILLLVGHWYANREAASATSLTNIPLGVEALLSGHKYMECYG